MHKLNEIKFKRGKQISDMFWGVATKSRDKKQSKVVCICVALTHETEQIKLVKIVGIIIVPAYCYSSSFELRYNQLYLLRYTINLSKGNRQWEASSQVRRSRSGRMICPQCARQMRGTLESPWNPEKIVLEYSFNPDKIYIYYYYGVYETIVQLSQL